MIGVIFLLNTRRFTFGARVRHDIALNLTAARLDVAGLHEFWSGNEDLEALRDASAVAVEAT